MDLRGGDYLANPGGQQAVELRKTELLPTRKKEFYFLCLLITLTAVVLGGSLLLSGVPLWILREIFIARLGTAVIILYFPMSMLAFYIQQTDCLTRHGTVLLSCLLLAAFCAASPLGERTNYLLPVLICLLFRRPPRLTYLVGFVTTIFVIAALLLPIMKGQYAGK